MQQSDECDVEWYVIFTDAKYPHWIWRFVDRSMGHVYAVQSLNDYQWLVINPRVNMTQAKILLKCHYPVIRSICAPEDEVLRARVNASVKLRGGPCWFTCVEQIKALLGISSFWTLTPKQLYNGLRSGRYGPDS